MTIKQACEKWGVSHTTLRTLCKAGLIEGTELVPYNAAQFAWSIPDDAKLPQDRHLNPSGVKRVPEIAKKSPSFPLTPSEIEAHLRRFAGSHTYSQLCKETGLPMGKIREIFDRLHAKYGI